MRIRTQLLIAALAAAVVAVIVIGSLWYVTQRSAASLRSEIDSQDIARNVANLLALTQEYTVYGGDRATEQWHARYAQLRQTVEQALARESVPHPALAEMHERVLELLPMYEGLETAFRDGGSDLAQRRRELMVERLMTETQELVDARHRWATAIIEQRARQQSVATAIVLMSSAVLLALIVGLAVLVSRRGLVPLAKLQAATAAIQRGDLSVRCESSSRDELGETGRAVNAMAESLLAANAALHESEERYQLAVAGSNEGLWDWNLTSNMMYLSPRAQELFGLEPGAPSRPRREWNTALSCHPEDREPVRSAISAYLRGASRHLEIEYRIRHRSGQWHWYRYRGVALRDGGGHPYRMAGSMEDITDRKLAQEELLRLERQLRQAQRLEAMGTLAGGIAHDFNNILAVILGYGEVALRGAPPGSRLRRDLDNIMAAGERGRALVDRILVFSRSGAEERVAVHVEEVVREAVELIAAKLPQNVTIETRLRAGRAAMLGDPTQVHQVLMNLATNAIQAMASGGTLRISLDVEQLEAPYVATTGTMGAGEYIVLTVADSGTGIPEEIIERIFDPFFTTKEVGVGTGLGLSLVHGIVGDLGGVVDVKSAVGVGSVFTVYLPRTGDADDDGECAAERLPRGDRQHVLIVDDEGPLASLAKENLAELGYVPVAFTSSKAALEAFRAHPERYDAVITDERMPGMSGSALIREIRGIRRAIPTLLVSGYHGAELVVRAKEAGADEVLKKPLSAGELATSLARVLRE